MKMTRNTSSGKRTIIAHSGIVLFIVILFWIIGGQKSFAQGVGISEVLITPDPTAVLELRSTLRGLLAPRMTTGQRDAIATPAIGLLIYNTDANAFNYYNGTVWIAILNTGTGVTSVSGTLNRISVVGTTTPVIDIDANYIGQTSISTLGTITNGIWNGTRIGLAYGGTNTDLSGGAAIGDILFANSATSFARRADIAVGNALISGGVGVAPTWGKIGLTTHISGTLPIANGGTGQTTKAAAFNALSPITTLGDMIYGSAANTSARLAGNTSLTSMFLKQTGTGAASAAPVWASLVKSDVGLSNVENTALSTWPGSTNLITLGTITSGTWNGTVIGIANGGTGQTTQQTAINALAGGTTSGQYLRGNGTDVVLSLIQVTDIPTLNQNTTGTAANVTGIVAPANGGTGLSTFGGTNTVLFTTAVNALSSVPASTAAGQFLQTDAIGGVPTWKTVLSVANGGTGSSTWSFWNIDGNAGTTGTAGTNFIGTTDGQELVFKTNSIERARLYNSASDTSIIRIGNAGTVSGTIKANKELVLRQDLDKYGPSILRLRNRTGENGAIFETTDPTYPLVDFIFRTSDGGSGNFQRNIRFEARTLLETYHPKTGRPSFHIGGADALGASDPDHPTLSIGDNYSAFKNKLIIGDINYNNNTPPTALLQLAAGTAVAGTAPLKFTTGANLTTAEAGVVEFDGDVFYSTPKNSSRGVSPSEYFIALTSNYTAVNNALSQKVFNNPPNGTITLAGSTSYMFEGQYNISSTGVNPATLGTSFGGTATVTSISYTAVTTKAAVGVNVQATFSSFVTTAANTTVTISNSTNNVTVIIHGIVRINSGGGGTFIPQFQFSTAPGNDPTIALNSYFKIYPVGTNTVNSVGNWN
jgi:hypothetical protein